MQASFVIGVNETHDKVIPQDILKYFGVSIFYKELDRWPTSITASIASAAGFHCIQKSNTVVYGIEIPTSADEDDLVRTIAEYTINSFVDFMYTHYKLEYEHYSEILCIKLKEELLHLYIPVHTRPEDINCLEYNITITNTQGTPDSIISDMKDSISLEIAKAGFKLNMAGICLEPSEAASDMGIVSNSKIYFNINTCSDIRTWAHSIKRKIKKKFHCIESFKFEENH